MPSLIFSEWQEVVFATLAGRTAKRAALPAVIPDAVFNAKMDIPRAANAGSPLHHAHARKRLIDEDRDIFECRQASDGPVHSCARRGHLRRRIRSDTPGSGCAALPSPRNGVSPSRHCSGSVTMAPRSCTESKEQSFSVAGALSSAIPATGASWSWTPPAEYRQRGPKRRRPRRIPINRPDLGHRRYRRRLRWIVAPRHRVGAG